MKTTINTKQMKWTRRTPYNQVVYIQDENKRVVARTDTPEDAEVILRAVNSYESMLVALKKVERYAFKACGDEFLMWVQEAIAQAEDK